MPTFTRRRRTIRALLAVGVLSATLAACGGSGAAAPDGSLTFGVNNPQLLGSAYITSIPTSLGYWEQEGLNVDVQSFDGSGEIVTAVATEKILIGSGGTRSNFRAHVNGGADTKAFYAYIPGNPFYPVVTPDSPLRSLADLQGKTVGVYSLAGEGAGLIKAAMQKLGLDAASVEFVDVGVGGTAIQSLKEGRIAAYMAYDSAYAQIEANGFPLRRLDSPIDEYGFAGNIIARPGTLESQPETLVKFGRGLAKASTFVKANPECAVKIHWAKYPDSRPAGVPDDEALQTGVEALTTRMENVFQVSDQWGLVTRETVQETIETSVAGGIISEPVELDAIWTPALLDEINQFDAEQIRQQARQCDLEALLQGGQ